MLDWLNKKAKRILRIIAGFLLILVAGLLGIVPFLPGFPLALAGLVLLSYEFEWAKKLRQKIHDKAHQAGEWVRRHRQKGDAELKHRDTENGE